MKSELRFETQPVRRANLGEEAGVPDIMGSLILQNDLSFNLDETDEIYEGYGKRPNSYPYRQYLCYDRELHQVQMKTAVLENDFIKAVFLPEYGGRLWELTDKKKNQNLLYTNDVIRFSNLAMRNAWFSGGAEWNVGVIGHTPLTTEPLNMARLTLSDGTAVLRMYAYERIRGVEYQMDFWLGDTDSFLNCRMRIVNAGNEVVPMYWWSNIAVPEYENGRIAVPAEEAFTSKCGEVYKVGLPLVEGVDVSHYQTIPDQVDYFFHVPDESPKYIANLDASGYGLLQMSTKRLKGRKMFSWGNNKGSGRWQEFLTEDAGKYLEIQAGLGKTQYGCIPMAPHSAWEWLEQYGPVQIKEEEQRLPFAALNKLMTANVLTRMEERKPEEVLVKTRDMAKTKGELISTGNDAGAWMHVLRKGRNELGYSQHLEYGKLTAGQKIWADFMESGSLPARDPYSRPDEFQCDRIVYDRLLETINNQNKNSWYAHYHLGLMHLYYGAEKEAMETFMRSLELEENPWAYHAAASVHMGAGDCKACITHMKKGLLMYHEELSYVKEGLRLLLLAKGYADVICVYELLTEKLQAESRILFDYITALSFSGEEERAYELLCRDGGLELCDLREGEDSLGELYVRLYESIHGEKPQAIPHAWDFHAMDMK